MAFTDAGRWIKNAPSRIVFPFRDTAGNLVTGATSIAPFVSKDSNTFVAATNTVTNWGSTGIYCFDLTETEMTVVYNVAVYITSATAVAHFENIAIEPAMESGVAQAGASSSITLRTGASATDDLYNGGVIEIVRGTGAGQTRVCTDYTGSSKIATTGRAWTTIPDSTSVYQITAQNSHKVGADLVAESNIVQIDSTSAPAVALSNLYGGTTDATVNDASATDTSFIGSAGLSSVDDFYNNQLIVFTDGALAGQTRIISDYNGTTKTITLTAALTSAPANGVGFTILSYTA